MQREVLIKETKLAAKRSGISRANWNRLLKMLEPLVTHAPEMYDHSLRVGLNACGLASLNGDNTSLALHGGCAHDVGKCMVPVEVIYAEPYTSDHRKAMDVHPEAGFEMLKDSNFFSACVAGLHHTFQENPYGIDLDNVAPWLNAENRKLIMQISEIVSVADYYDALRTRPGPSGSFRTDDEVGTLLKGRFGDCERTEWLLYCGVR